MLSSPAHNRFLHDNRGLSSYPSRVAYAVAYQENLDVPDLTYVPSSPETSSTSSASSPRTPDRVHRPLSAEPASTSPGRVPRPRNAFIIFRCEYNPKIKAWIAAITSKRKVNKNKSVKSINQNIVSIIAGRIWRFLSDEERQPYREKAGEVKLQHRIQYPDYKYQPPSNRRVKRVDSTPVKRVRSQKPYSRPPKKAPDASNDVMPLGAPYMPRAKYVSNWCLTIDTATQPLAPVESQFGYRPDSTWLPSPPITDWQQHPYNTTYPVQNTRPSFDTPENQETLDALKSIDFDVLSSLVNQSYTDSQASASESHNAFEYAFLQSTSSHYQTLAPTYQNADEGLEQLINQYQ